MDKDRTQLADSLLQGVRGDNKTSKGIREAVGELFKPNELVTIRNPFDHTTGWVYVDPSDESIQQPDKATRRVEYGEPQARTIEPGEKVTIPGWEAYIALSRMFKEYAQEAGSNVGVVMASGESIDDFISKSYIGIFNPNSINQQSEPSIDVEDADGDNNNRQDQDLGFAAPKTQVEDNNELV